MLGAGGPVEDLFGTTIHELTHHAADMTFGNEAIPFDDEEQSGSTGIHGRHRR